jgi:hypothetical protein
MDQCAVEMRGTLVDIRKIKAIRTKPSAEHFAMPTANVLHLTSRGKAQLQRVNLIAGFSLTLTSKQARARGQLLMGSALKNDLRCSLTVSWRTTIVTKTFAQLIALVHGLTGMLVLLNVVVVRGRELSR